jgi:hypothetical protein
MTNYEERQQLLQQVYERGDFRTIIYEGKYGDPRIEVIALDSIGSKYIRGVYIYRDPQTGEIEPRTTWNLTKIPKEGATIVSGQHWELQDRLRTWEAAKSNHRHLKEKAERIYEAEARERATDEVNRQMIVWNELNPEPTFT